MAGRRPFPPGFSLPGAGSARTKAGGFSLVELLVVMTVLGVLAAAMMPMAEIAVQRERERELKRALWEIRDAIDTYKRAADAGLVPRGASGWPPSLQALTDGVPDARSGERHYFLRRIPADPFAPPGQEPDLTWGLRSYASEPDRPQPGADVYDIHSLSDGIGLNGVPLRQW